MAKTNEPIKMAQEDVDSCARTVAMLAGERNAAEAAHATATAEHETAKRDHEDARRACGASTTDATRAQMHAAADAETEAAARVAHAERSRQQARANHADASGAHARAQERLQIAQDTAIASPSNFVADTRDDVTAIVSHLRGLFEVVRRYEARAQAASEATARLAKKGQPLARNAADAGVSTVSSHVVLGPVLLALGADYGRFVADGMTPHPYGALRHGYTPGSLSSLVLPGTLVHEHRAPNAQREADARAELEAALASGVVSLAPGPTVPRQGVSGGPPPGSAYPSSEQVKGRRARALG